MKEKVLERLLRYVKIDTTSDSSSTTCPSTEKQFDLARVFMTTATSTMNTIFFLISLIIMYIISKIKSKSK